MDSIKELNRKSTREESENEMRSTKDVLRKENKSELIINKAMGNQTV